MFKKLFLFLFIVMFNYSGFSQNSFYEYGLPFLKNYTPKEYHAHFQNWAVEQDSLGLMYFGNQSGYLIYDGAAWYSGQVPNKSMVRSLAYDNGRRVYLGAYAEFGYVEIDKEQNLQYRSLLNKLDDIYKNFEDVWSTHYTSNAVFFQTRDYLFIYRNDTVKVVSPETSFQFAFLVDNRLFIRQRQIGLMELIQDTLRLVPDGEMIADNGIFGMLPINRKEILLLTNQGLMIFNGKSINNFANDINTELIESQMYHGSILPDGNIAIATFYSGVFIINSNGKLLYKLDKSTGLQDDYVLNTFVDKDGSLWLALNNGISKVEISNPLSRFVGESGLIGNVSDICRYNDELYVSTSVGVFKLNSLTRRFQKIALSSDKQILECWDIQIVDGSLLVATSFGIYEIRKNYPARLISSCNSQCLYGSVINKNYVYAGTQEGLKFLQKKNAGWNDVGTITNDINDIQFIYENRKGDIWLTTYSQGVYKINIKNISSPDDAAVVNYDTSSGLPSAKENYIFEYNGEEIFATIDGIYKFNPAAEMFEQFSQFNDLFNLDSVHVFRIIEDNDRNIWAQIDDGEKPKIGVIKFDGVNYENFSNIHFARAEDFVALNIFSDQDKVVWFGGADGLLRYDSKLSAKGFPEYFSVIRSISEVNTQKSVFTGFASNAVSSTIPILDHTENSLRFEFGAASYENETANMYQVYLENFDEGWSNWTLENKKDYTNIPGGEYTFRVRAKNIYGRISKESFYSLEILNPWYKTFWAYSLYILGFIFTIYSAVRLRSEKLKRDNVALEKLIAERTAEVERQKEQLKSEKEKSDELLYNILPEEIAEELKVSGTTISKRFEEVSILFTDFKGFTNTMASMPAQKITSELNDIFRNFDDIVLKHNLEKIKTIGDAYMIAGGLPKENSEHAIKCILTGKEMLAYLQKRNDSSAIKWQMRVGIHSGSVIAGVVGKHKFTYDIWGDTVNIASRMESSGEPGRINISAYTYDLVKDHFECEYRGKIDAKGKGDIDMYFVKD